MKENNVMNLMKTYLSIYFNNVNILLFVFIFSLTFYIRLDAELMILLSVLLVLFTVWTSLTDMLSTLLLHKSTLYYYYLVRFYQSRMWLIYLSYKYIMLNLHTSRLPYFIKWYKFYSRRIVEYISVQGSDLSVIWDRLINHFSFIFLKYIMCCIWVSLYRTYIKVYFASTVEFDAYSLNMRKLTQYVLLNGSSLA
jgi:hypothetical protein